MEKTEDSPKFKDHFLNAVMAEGCSGLLFGNETEPDQPTKPEGPKDNSPQAKTAHDLVMEKFNNLWRQFEKRSLDHFKRKGKLGLMFQEKIGTQLQLLVTGREPAVAWTCLTTFCTKSQSSDRKRIKRILVEVRGPPPGTSMSEHVTGMLDLVAQLSLFENQKTKMIRLLG